MKKFLALTLVLIILISASFAYAIGTKCPRCSEQMTTRTSGCEKTTSCNNGCGSWTYESHDWFTNYERIYEWNTTTGQYEVVRVIETKYCLDCGTHN